MTQLQKTYCLIAAVNDDQVLNQNLADSPLLEQGVALKAMRGFKSASEACNAGMKMAAADVMIFAHQDIYFPRDWLAQLDESIRRIEQVDKDWGVIGVYGVDGAGTHVGRCWSTGLGKVLGAEFSDARKVRSIDEIVIVVRTASGIAFDENLPGFHLYGTDIVQIALDAGFGAYVIHAPVIHNSKPVRTLAGAYSQAYTYMRRKWKNKLPIATTVVPVTRFGYPLLRYKIRTKLRGLLRRGQTTVVQEKIPGRLHAQRLGFE